MRLDKYLVENKLCETRSKALDLIKRGFILVDGKIAKKGGIDIINQKIEIIEHMSFVGRAGEKLYGAIKRFDLDFNDKTCIDIGASTGGFTDCALKSGASKVYTYDVGKDQMVDVLKNDERVIVHEETNILDVQLPQADMIMIDVSFISIIKVFEHLLDYNKEIIALIKPQFEVGKKRVKQGVIKDKKIHKKILEDTLNKITKLGFNIIDLERSDILGKKGNQEYMVYINGLYMPDTYISDLIGAIL